MLCCRPCLVVRRLNMCTPLASQRVHTARLKIFVNVHTAEWMEQRHRRVEKGGSGAGEQTRTPPPPTFGKSDGTHPRYFATSAQGEHEGRREGGSEAGGEGGGKGGMEGGEIEIKVDRKDRKT